MRIVHALVGGLALSVCSAPSLAYDVEDLIGQEVVLKSLTVNLVDNGKKGVSGRKFQRYKVERTDGPLLWIVSDALSGWVQADKVIRLDRADEYFTGRIQRNPDSSSAFWKRGMVRLYRKEIDQAISDFNEAIRCRANSPHAYNSRGLAWSQKKEYDKAISDFSESLRIEPGIAGILCNRGAAWLLKNDYEQAVADLSTAIQIDPRVALFFLNRGNARAGQKDYNKAIADYTEALRIEPKYVIAYNNRAAMWHNQKDYSRAIADYVEAIRVDPKSVPSLKTLAWVLATCPEEKYRDGKRAIGLAFRACELSNWNDPDALDSLAAAFAESGDFDLSVKWQQKVLDILRTTDRGYEEARARLELYKSRKPYRGEPDEQ